MSKNEIKKSVSNETIEKLEAVKPELDDVYSIIEKIVADMRNEKSLWSNNPEEFKNQIKLEYPQINESYPSIFNVIFNPKFDLQSMQRLKYMISMAKRVQKKDIAEHDASVAVGQRLVDDIVKPQLNEK